MEKNVMKMFVILENCPVMFEQDLKQDDFIVKLIVCMFV